MVMFFFLVTTQRSSFKDPLVSPGMKGQWSKPLPAQESLAQPLELMKAQAALKRPHPRVRPPRVFIRC